MNTTVDKNIALKRNYNEPEINIVKLDNEISLALESQPPPGPGESALNLQELLNNNPFKETVV